MLAKLTYNTSDMMIEKTTAPASYAASLATGLFGVMTLNEIAIIVGIVLSILTFGVNWFYKHKAHLRAEKWNGEDRRDKERS